jgi:hypothetical protein
MALQTFDSSYYLSNNQDVLNAVLSGQFTSAEQHYVLFGEREGRMPSAFFDPTGYLANNADVFAAVQSGVFSTGLEHYELYGAAEDRTPGNLPFNETFYLAENSDVAAAVAAGTFSSGWQHYVLFGASEGRIPADGVPGGITGDTFNLTTAPFEALTGTPNNDVINGIIDTAASGNSTFNTGDNVNGAAGNDTFNLFLDANGTPPAGSGVVNTEVINLVSNGFTSFSTGPGGIDAGYFEGATQIWQIGNNPGTASNLVNVGGGTTIGFRDGATANVAAADAATTAAIALDGVLAGQGVVVTEATADDVQTVSLSGSLEVLPGPAVAAFNLNLAALGDARTVNVALSTEADLTGSNYGTATTLDASGSTGALTMTAGAIVETVLGGSAADTITTGAATTSVTGNAGADDVTLWAGAAEEIVIAAGDTGITAATADTYGTFTIAEDTFNFGLDAGTAANFEDGGLSSSFTDGLTNANTAFASTPDLLYFVTNDGADTYLFVDRDANGSADEGVTLTGVVAIDFDNIVA